MQPLQAKASLTYLCDQKVPVFLWGPPGIGKSSIVAQIARDEGIGFKDLRLSLLDPTDLRGIPFFDAASHQAVWAPPAFLPSGKEPEGILFLDELNAAPPMVQASAYQLILDRKIGEYALPEGWSIVAAGNREGDRGVVYRMPSPLANRFVHLEMEPSVEDWRRWAVGAGIDATIIGFIGYRPDALFAFDAKHATRAFATPRSWEYVNKIVQAHPKPELLMPLVSGAVGDELAASFLSFRQVAEALPALEEILSGGNVSIPDANDALHVLSAAIIRRVDAKASIDLLENLLDFTLRLPGEFAVMIVKELRQRGVNFERAPGWKTWVRTFSYLLA